jgi:molybdopterin converting factor small subunit
MSVTLNLPNVLARLADGQTNIISGGNTVGAVIDNVTARYPALAPRLRGATGEQYAFVTIYLNDEDIRFAGGFDANVKDGDEVVVVPAIAGG